MSLWPCVFALQGNIRADGADEADSALFLARAAAEEAISSAEAAQERGDQVTSHTNARVGFSACFFVLKSLPS